MIKEPYPKEIRFSFKKVDKDGNPILDIPDAFKAGGHNELDVYDGEPLYHLSKTNCDYATMCACYKVSWVNQHGGLILFQGYHKPYSGKARARLHGEVG